MVPMVRAGCAQAPNETRPFPGPGVGWPSQQCPLPGNSPAALRSRGVALISVLVVLSVLALIAANFSGTVRTQTRLTTNLIANARAEALADAAVHLAVLGLSDPDPLTKWVPDGRRYRDRMGETDLIITMTDETGKIDLNKAQDELLQGLFESAGMAKEPARALVDAVVDFRDPDNLRRLNGAEDDQYAEAGLSYGAKDAPFEVVSELRLVLGMTRDLYQAVEPVLTVWSRRPGLNPQFASREALMAIPGMQADQVEAYLDKRLPETASEDGDEEEQPYQEEALKPIFSDQVAGRGPSPDSPLAALPQSPEVSRYYTLGKSRFVYTILAEARLGEREAFLRHAVIRLTGDARRPFETLLWKVGFLSGSAENPSVEDTP